MQNKTKNEKWHIHSHQREVVDKMYLGFSLDYKENFNATQKQLAGMGRETI